MDVLGRYKNLVILVGVLFLQVLGLAVQVKRSGEAANTRLIRIWAVSAVTPIERSVVWVQNGLGGIWHNYFYLRGVRAENRQLKDQIEQMRLEQVRLREDAAQAQRLQALLSFKEQTVSKTVAAQVIGSSPPTASSAKFFRYFPRFRRCCSSMTRPVASARFSKKLVYKARCAAPPTAKSCSITS